MTHPQVMSEPMRKTLSRTVGIAMIAAFVASRWMGGMSRWPVLTILALWPSFGGHWVEVAYLRWIRPRLPEGSSHTMARLATWFAGGILLAAGMLATARFVFSTAILRWPGLWLGGIAFVVIELIAHSLLQLRGAPSFYNRRG